MGFNSSRVVRHQDKDITITYNLLNTVVMVRSGGALLLRKGIWLPYQSLGFTLNNELLQLKVRTFPLCRFSLESGEQVVCANIFPRMRRRSLVWWALTPARLIAALLSKVLS